MTHPTTACDIAIIGAGPAGVTAAVAAKRAGAHRVMLIEQSDKTGGAVSHAMHRAICGLYANQPADFTHTLNQGLQREVVTHMHRLAPNHVQLKQMGKACVLEFPPDAWQSTLLTLCKQAGVELHLNTTLSQIKRDGRRIIAIRIEPHTQDIAAANSAANWITPSVVIDATGQGHVLKLAGEDTFQQTAGCDKTSPPRMMGGYAMRLANLTGDTSTLRLQIPFTLAKAVAQNQLPAVAKLTVFHPGPAHDQGVCKLAVSPADLLDTDAIAQRAAAIFKTLQASIDTMRHAIIIEQSPTAQPRDGRRLRGKFTLTQQHVLDAVAWPDDPLAVKAWWPIERWDDANGPSYVYGETGCPYEIPTAALRCEAVDNLLAAGMNISADAYAAASLRASGICLGLGEAAGRVAVSLLQG